MVLGNKLCLNGGPHFSGTLHIYARMRTIITHTHSAYSLYTHQAAAAAAAPAHTRTTHMCYPNVYANKKRTFPPPPPAAVLYIRMRRRRPVGIAPTGQRIYQRQRPKPKPRWVNLELSAVAAATTPAATGGNNYLCGVNG